MKLFSVVFFLFLSSFIHAQAETMLKPGRIVFYNVENFFDTINDPETQDDEFTPESKIKWNTEKYELKLNHISKVIATLFDTIQPLVVGLSEVENRQVLEDLIAQPALKKFNFGIIHHDSPDERGIDVAFLYNKDIVANVFDAFLRINYPFDSTDKTRDILYFKGFVTEDTPVYFFVNHWPSRRKANGDSEKKRLYVSKILRDKIENIYIGEPHARIIAMGDFNDNPTDSSLEYLCSGTNPHPVEEDLVDLMTPLYVKKEFTLKYRSELDLFDQFIVSKNLLNRKNSYYVRNLRAYIFNPRWLLFNSPKYGMEPNRTYAYNHWVAGYSDHLPVYIDLKFY